jgi:hypothetical protein
MLHPALSHVAKTWSAKLDASGDDGSKAAAYITEWNADVGHIPLKQHKNATSVDLAMYARLKLDLVRRFVLIMAVLRRQTLTARNHLNQ